MVPKVVIVGRPNVGKSSLLNMLAGRKVSIVDPTPGVTRDRIATIARLPGPLAGAPPEDEEVTPGPLGPDEDELDDELENELEDEEAPDAEREQEDDNILDDESGPKALDAARARGLGVDDDDNDDTGVSDKFLEVIDTGGYGIQDTQNLTADVERQITVGLTEADLILFVVDAQTGIVPLDQEVARLLRQRSGKNHGKPIVLVANKVDGPSFEAGAAEAARLGLGQPVLLSAKNGLHKRALYDAIRQKIDWSRFPDADREPDLGIKLAIVGKRNVGKSTLVNALAGEDRVIVSELEGTTRDSVDVRFTVGDHLFTAIDTAGLRRGRSVQGKDIEYYSQHRALRSVRRSDVAIFLIDATVPISHVDSQLSAEILRLHKPTVIVVNKWDLAQGKATQEEYGEYLTKELRGLDFAPIVFTSALRVEGVREVVSLAYNLYQQAGHRVPTAELNAVLEAILAERPPTSGIGRQAKIRYLTQTDVHPPTITMFVNDPTMFDAGYQRYLLGQLREKLPYAEVPIKLVIRGRRQGETQENEPRQ